MKDSKVVPLPNPPNNDDKNIVPGLVEAIPIIAPINKLHILAPLYDIIPHEYTPNFFAF